MTTPKTKVKPPALLTGRDVAARLAISVRTVKNLVRDGILPQPIRLGRRINRWRARDIDRCLRKLIGEDE